MNTPGHRFNLRARKSLKLNGQIECNSCSRYYFPANFSEDYENGDQTENMCCDCKGKKNEFDVPKAKKRAVQRKNLTEVKIEKTEFNGNQIGMKMPDGNGNNLTRGSELNNGGMVQIHSIELLDVPVKIVKVIGKFVVHFFKIVFGSFEFFHFVANKNVKKEKLVSTSVEVTNANKSNRVLRNRTNTIQTQEKYEDDHAVQTKHEITRNDTADTLREKFPNVNAFEFQFLLFIKDQNSFD